MPIKPAIWLSLIFIHTSIISKHTHYVIYFIKNPHISESTTILPHDSTAEIVWGHANNNKYPREIFASPLNTNHRTSTLQSTSKRLKPLDASLFYLLPTYIIKNIEIWVPGLEHCNKFNHIFSRFKTMCNPILFTMPNNLWNAYHNSRALSWYNEEHYSWIHIQILAK